MGHDKMIPSLSSLKYDIVKSVKHKVVKDIE